MKNAIYLGAVIAACSTAATAELLIYDLEWSGLNFQNEVTATGQVTIDTGDVENPGSYFGEWEGSAFSDFSITVTGSQNGDGTFSTDNDDFASVIWNVSEKDDDRPLGGVEPLDLYSELMGQIGFNDFNVFSNEFLLGGNETPVPTGANPFTLVVGSFDFTTNGVDGQLIELVSMTQPPPPSHS